MCRVIFVVERCCVIESNKAMISRKLFQMPVLHGLFRHSQIHWVAIVCFVACAILFSSVVRQKQLEPSFEEPVFDSQACHLVVLLQDDDDEGDDEDDDVDDEPAPDLFANWGTTEAKVLGAKRFLLKQEFQMELDRVNAVCSLEPKQIKKLEIASKGGVKKSLKDWRKKILTQFGMLNRNGMNAEDDDKREPVEEEQYTDVDDINQMALLLASNEYVSNVNNETTPNNSFWKKTLKSTLSKDQKKVWDDFITEQRKAKRKKMAEAAIEKLSFELGLTPDQKGKFAELVLPEIQKAKLETVETIGKHYESHLYLYHASKVKESKLKLVLSSAQMQKWKAVSVASKQYASYFEDKPVRRANGNLWERQGFGLTAFLEAAADFFEAVVDIGNRIFKGQ